jgi:hypothetical protein
MAVWPSDRDVVGYRPGFEAGAWKTLGPVSQRPLIKGVPQAKEPCGRYVLFLNLVPIVGFTGRLLTGITL